MKQFLQFSVVGVLGFLVDTAILYAVLAFGDYYYSGRVVSFLGAVTFTWYMNRTFTFRNRSPDLFRQWFHFLVTNSGGGLVNILVYSLLIASFELVRSYPILGVAVGSIAGLTVNFTLSRKFVFRTHGKTGSRVL